LLSSLTPSLCQCPVLPFVFLGFVFRRNYPPLNHICLSPVLFFSWVCCFDFSFLFTAGGKTLCVVGLFTPFVCAKSLPDFRPPSFLAALFVCFPPRSGLLLGWTRGSCFLFFCVFPCLLYRVFASTSFQCHFPYFTT